MTKMRIKVGSGITAEWRTTYSGEDLREGFAKFAESWSARLTICGGSNFGAAAMDYVKWAKENLNHGDMHRRDFARRYLTAYNLSLRQTDIDLARRFAHEAGMIAAAAYLKFQWEGAAIAGNKSIEGGRKGSRKAHGDKKRIHKQWADEMQKLTTPPPNGPGLTKTEAYKEIARCDPMKRKPGSIRNAVDKFIHNSA